MKNLIDLLFNKVDSLVKGSDIVASAADKLLDQIVPQESLLC